MLLVDILLFIPRLVWELLCGIWSVLSFIGLAIWGVISEFLPQGAGESWWPFVILVGVIILAIFLRSSFGGFFKALGAIVGAAAVITIMFLINPWYAGVNILVAVLVACDKIRMNNWSMMAMTAIWAILIIVKIAG